MGVVAPRRSRVSRSARTAYRMRGRPLGRAAVRGNPAAAPARIAPAMPQWPVDDRKSFWARLDDDRQLIRFKILLLTSLLLIAALLEWVA